MHQHPYQPFIPQGATRLIVGTLPPPRFSTGDLKEGDVDFCYGSRDGQLWRILNEIFNLRLTFETTPEAVEQRKEFLIAHKIGICDIVESAEREKIDASDFGMNNVKLRNLIGYLRAHSTINTLLFTGGNSKNGPEYFFRKHLKVHRLSLTLVSDSIPKIHTFLLPSASGEAASSVRIIKTISLTSPSGSANRAVGGIPLYRALKKQNPDFTVMEFRVLQYKKIFNS